MISQALDPSIQQAHRARNSARLATLLLVSIALAFGCGNDEDTRAAGTNGAGATNGTGATNGSGATGGNGAAPFSGAVLCSLVRQPEGAGGFVRLVPDEELEAGGEISATEGAIEIAGGTICAVRGTAVFTGSFETPTLTRWDIVDGELAEGDTVSFMNLGLSSVAAASSDSLQVFSDTKAYFFDQSSLQIVVWDPTAMTVTGSIDVAPIFAPPQGLAVSRIRATQIGGRFVVWGHYQNAQGVGVARAVFAFVDPETDEIVSDTSDQCGGFLSASITTSNGDTYFGSTGVVAIDFALGLEGSFEPCALRVRAGATEIDSSFVADLNQLTGVGPTAGPFTGSGTTGFLFAYDPVAVPPDPMLTSFEHLQIPNWRLYEVELGSTGPARLVEELPAGAGVGSASNFDGRALLFQGAPDFTSTNALDLSQRPIDTVFVFSGSPIFFARVQGEPRSRMAQRMEPRRGLTVLPF